MSLSSTIEPINPGAAKKLLQKSVFRGRHSTQTIKKWAEMMRAGEWVFTGEPLILDEFGQMVDGVGRMQALVLAGVEVSFLVVRGVLRDHAKNIDTGYKRIYGDAYVNNNRANFAFIAKGISLYLRGERLPSTPGDVYDFMEKEKDRLQELTNFSRQLGNVHEFLSDHIIFAHALKYGIEHTCEKARKAAQNEDFHKLKGLPKLRALEKL